MNILEILAAFSTGIFTGYLIFHRAVTWKRIIPDKQVFRGPNADVVYNGIKVEGDRYAFTDEQLDVASERALKVWQ